MQPFECYQRHGETSIQKKQLMSSALATELRNTEWSRAKIDDVAIKGIIKL